MKRRTFIKATSLLVVSPFVPKIPLFNTLGEAGIRGAKAGTAWSDYFNSNPLADLEEASRLIRQMIGKQYKED